MNTKENRRHIWIYIIGIGILLITVILLIIGVIFGVYIVNKMFEIKIIPSGFERSEILNYYGVVISLIITFLGIVISAIITFKVLKSTIKNNNESLNKQIETQKEIMMKQFEFQMKERQIEFDFQIKQKHIKELELELVKMNLYISNMPMYIYLVLEIDQNVMDIFKDNNQNSEKNITQEINTQEQFKDSKGNILKKNDNYLYYQLLICYYNRTNRLILDFNKVRCRIEMLFSINDRCLEQDVQEYIKTYIEIMSLISKKLNSMLSDIFHIMQLYSKDGFNDQIEHEQFYEKFNNFRLNFNKDYIDKLFTDENKGNEKKKKIESEFEKFISKLNSHGN